MNHIADTGKKVVDHSGDANTMINIACADAMTAIFGYKRVEVKHDEQS